MSKIIAILGLLLLAQTGTASAQSCGTLPYSLTNGTTADATQVTGDLNALLGCINSNGLVNGGTAGQVAYYNATGSAISGESLSALLDSSLGSTQGSILYRGATGWTVLAPGTNGYVLQTNGAAANPSWVSPGGGGGTVYTAPACGSVTLMGDSANSTCSAPISNVLTLRTTAAMSGHIIGVGKTFSTTFTLTVQMAPLGSNTVNSSTPSNGLCLTDGTKYETFSISVNIGAQTVRLVIDQFNSFTSHSSSPLISQTSSVANAAWMRMTYNTSTGVVTYYYSPDGLDYDQVYSHTVTGFMTPTSAGVCGYQTVAAAANTAGFRIYQWSGL